MRRLFAVLAAGLLLALGPGARADGLRVLSTPADIFGLEAVGRLDWQSGGRTGFCTGTLVAPRLVLTAAHCVFGPDGAAIDSAALSFRAGLRRGQAKAERGVRRVAVHPAYRPEAGLTAAGVASDLALLELDRPLDYWAVPPLRTGTGLDRGQSVQVVSYARGRDATPSHEAACSVLARTGRVFALDCEATFGASGAPVFVATTRGLRIVSVISATGSLGDRQATFSVAIEDSIDLLRQSFPRASTPTRVPSPGVKTVRPGGTGGTIRFLRPGE